MRTSSLVVTACLALLSSGAMARSPKPSLEQTLNKQIGKGRPVALLPGAAGLTAVSADGKRQRVLVKGPVDWVLSDPQLGLVFFGTEKPRQGRAAFEVLDVTLPEDDAGPVTIAAKLPVPAVIRVHRPGGPGLSYDAPQAAGLDLQLDASKKVWRLKPDPALLANWEDQEKAFTQAMAKVRLSSKGTIALQGSLNRTPTKLLVRKPAPKVLPRVKLPADACDGDPCGEAVAVPGTSFQTVVVDYSCGDGCYTTRQLYDPKTREFIDAGKRSKTPHKGASFQLLQVASDGKTFVRDGVLVRMSDGKVLAGTKGKGGGWLRGGHVVGY